MILLSLALLITGAPPAPEADAAALGQAALTDSAASLDNTVEQMAREIDYKPRVKPQKIYNVEKSTTMVREGRRITFNQVAAPARPAAAIKAAPARTLTAQESLNLQNMESKPTESFTFFGTVYDERVTEITWHHEGHSYRAFIDADFSFLHSLGSFETETAYYSVVGFLSHENSEAAETWIPDQQFFSGQQGIQYVVVEPDLTDAELPPQAMTGLEALMDHYEANKKEIWRKYAKMKATNQARKKYYKENPPSQDITINVWKIEEGGQ